MRKTAATLWTVLILALCSIPGTELPEVDLLSADKIGHFLMFAGFGYLWSWALGGASRRTARRVFLFGLLCAVGSEIYQGILPIGRDPSAADAVANVAGLITGIFLYGLRRSSSKKASKPRN